MYEYLVKCKNRKKLVCVASREELKPRVSTLFEIPLWAVRIQMYIESFNDFVDVDDFDDIPASCKLTIIDLRDADDSEAGLSSASTVQLVDSVQMEPARASTGPDPSADDSDSVLVLMNSSEMVLDVTNGATDPLAIGIPAQSNRSRSETKDMLASNSDAVPTTSKHPDATDTSANGWFNPKVLSQHLQQKLVTKSRLVGRDWSEITDQIFSDYIQDTGSDHPAPSHYHRMVSAILHTYPHLTGPLRLDDAETWLRRKMQDKFRNLNRGRPNKRKHNDNDGEKETPGSKRRRQVVGLPGYDPKGTTNDTMAARNINLLKNTESEEEVDKLMDATFLPRRKAVLDGCGLAVCQRDYPALFGRRQFWKEVDRMAKKDDWLVEADAAVTDWCRKVAAACACAEDKALGQIWRILVGDQYPAVGPIFVKNEEAEATFRLESAAGVMLMETRDEKEALIALTLAYSVFNLSFPRKMKPMLLFVQKVVLRIDDGCKLPSKVVKFCIEQHSPIGA